MKFRKVEGRIEIKINKLPWPFPEAIHAVTIWPFIFYEPQVWDDSCIIIHEKYHWEEQKNWLVIPWLIAYGILAIKCGGGRNHPMEKGAYLAEVKCIANKS